MFEVYFIENFPAGNRIVITRLVPFSVLVCKSTFRIPRQESRIVVRNFVKCGVSQFCSLLVVPHGLVWIIGIGDGFVGLIHPLGNGAEVENGRMSLGGLQKIDCHRIDKGEVPERLAIFRWFQFRHTETRIRDPRYGANIVSSEIMERFERVVVHGGATAQRWVYDYL